LEVGRHCTSVWTLRYVVLLLNFSRRSERCSNKTSQARSVIFVCSKCDITVAFCSLYTTRCDVKTTIMTSPWTILKWINKINSYSYYLERNYIDRQRQQVLPSWFAL
jgi:hypothetical protein